MTTLEVNLSLANALVQNLSRFDGMAVETKMALSASILQDLTAKQGISSLTLQSYVTELLNGVKKCKWESVIIEENDRAFVSAVEYYYMLLVRNQREQVIESALQRLITF